MHIAELTRKLATFWPLGALLFCSAAAHAQSQTVEVSNTTQLVSAISSANNSGGNVTILLNDGTYTLGDTLYVNAPNVTIAGKTNAREKVIIQGDAMSASARVGNVIRVAASGFKLHHVTLQKAGWHLIQIAGETNADNPVISDCIMRDAYEQLMKISINTATPNVVSDNGRVENCLFEYTAGVGPQYYIGGIDGHGVTGWVVRNNTFRGIASPNTSVAEYAVHFWNNSKNNTVERNTIVNCDRGIGFGMQDRGNSGGIIRNNMIYHAANNAPFADAAIALADSPNSQIYNNTIVSLHNLSWTIEYRFGATTGVLIANNLTNKPILARDGATGTLNNNYTTASASLFKDAPSGNLHLASATASIVDAGRTISGLTDDFDGQSRPGGAGIDIGADEYASGVAPMPPTNVRVQ